MRNASAIDALSSPTVVTGDCKSKTVVKFKTQQFLSCFLGKHIFHSKSCPFWRNRFENIDCNKAERTVSLKHWDSEGLTSFVQHLRTLKKTGQESKTDSFTTTWKQKVVLFLIATFCDVTLRSSFVCWLVCPWTPTPRSSFEGLKNIKKCPKGQSFKREKKGKKHSFPHWNVVLQLETKTRLLASSECFSLSVALSGVAQGQEP